MEESHPSLSDKDGLLDFIFHFDIVINLGAAAATRIGCVILVSFLIAINL